MEKIIAKLNEFLSQFCIVCKVPCDKQMHFICGFIIAAILTPFRGAYMLYDVENGRFDELPLTLKYLKSKYGQDL